MSQLSVKIIKSIPPRSFSGLLTQNLRPTGYTATVHKSGEEKYVKVVMNPALIGFPNLVYSSIEVRVRDDELNAALFSMMTRDCERENEKAFYVKEELYPGRYSVSVHVDDEEHVWKGRDGMTDDVPKKIQAIWNTVQKRLPRA